MTITDCIVRNLRKNTVRNETLRNDNSQLRIEAESGRYNNEERAKKYTIRSMT